MSVIGVLLIIVAGFIAFYFVLPFINPIDILAQTRDAERKNAFSKIVGAMRREVANRGGYFFPPQQNWIDRLVGSDELGIIPQRIFYNSDVFMPCKTNSHNFYCYNTNSTQAIIYFSLESSAANARCNAGNGEKAYYIWSSTDDKSGTVCSAGEPTQFSGFTYK